jgi:hypothetical protein
MVRDSLDYARRFNGASVSAEIAALDAALAEPDAIARAVEAEREACAKIVYGLCISDNNAQEIVNAIRARGSK